MIRSVSELPNSTGGYAITATEYDVMGRVKRQSTPTETNSSWQPTGDDAVGQSGRPTDPVNPFLWMSYTYDWKGRVTETTNTDSTTTEAIYEGGLARFNGERFEEFKENLPEGLLSDLHIDNRGRLWISSALGGLIRVDDTGAKTPSFAYLTTKDGLTSNNIRTITEDRFGRIYVGTARGVDRLIPDTGRIKHYSVNDGLAADFVVDSHCDKDGNLWFATNSGVSRLVPLPDEKSSAPQVFIGGLRIAGIEQGVSDLGDKEIERGELSHTENNLQIDFFGLDFRAGETLRYQYKLEGSNADWSVPSEQRSVTFANLSPANYRFLVRAVNSEGITSENPAVLNFRILPPIWLRWWFITLCILALGLIAFVFYRYRISNLRAINEAFFSTSIEIRTESGTWTLQ